jgi:hypothetical protein
MALKMGSGEVDTKGGGIKSAVSMPMMASGNLEQMVRQVGGDPR